MTASVQNTRSAFKVLHNGLKWFREATHERVEDRVAMLETLARSAEKCLDSIDAQIRFYQSATGTGRAYWIEIDGKDEHVSAQHLKTLRLALPGADEDAVIHGKADALQAVAEALQAAGETVTGPATLRQIADQLADAAFQAGGQPPEKRKAKKEVKAHGSP